MATHATVVWAGGHIGLKIIRKPERRWWEQTGARSPRLLLLETSWFLGHFLFLHTKHSGLKRITAWLPGTWRVLLAFFSILPFSTRPGRMSPLRPMVVAGFMMMEAKRALKHLDMINKLKGWGSIWRRAPCKLRALSFVPVRLLGQVGSPLPTAQSLPNRPGSQVKPPLYFSFLTTLSFFFPFLGRFHNNPTWELEASCTSWGNTGFILVRASPFP